MCGHAATLAKAVRSQGTLDSYGDPQGRCASKEPAQ